MSSAKAPLAEGFTVFCEDIRAESSGQLTYVGVFQGDVATDYPATLPKFSLAITIRQPVFAPRDRLLLKVFLDEAVVFETDADFANAPPVPETVHEESSVAAQTVVTFSPLVIQEPITMRVRAYRGEEEIKLGSISFLQSAPKTP